MEQFSRLINLLGKSNFNKIISKNILLIGLGGVGGYTLESLIRNGIFNITIVDKDKVDITNINRQILSNLNNINEFKTDIALKRIKEINSNCNVKAINNYITLENINELNIKDYDYVIDCCDDVLVKVELIKLCEKNKIKLVSSMGTANKIDATLLEITKIEKTSYDPLAKKIRKLLPYKKYKYLTVISSKEKILQNKTLGTVSYVPGVSGLLITNYIINDILKSN